MTDAQATVNHKRRLSTVWIVPIVALAIGIWMLIYTIQSQGPEITIVFPTAEGIEEGKTKIKFRNVDVGLVTSAGLGEDLESVVVVAQFEKDAQSLLREDTQFWVVRPRIGKGGVSGLSTLLSGGYIQLAPGSDRARETEFIGLSEPPQTPAGTPGLRVVLTAKKAGSVNAGDPVLYDGYRVGWVETETFDPETRSMVYEVFIEAPYDTYINTSSRFWDVSGISVSAGADGIDVRLGSVESLVMGGIQVGRPEGIFEGEPVETGAIFELYESYADVNARPYRHSVEFVVEFPRSVRGLVPGAPVEYRGLPIGRVERVMLEELMSAGISGRGDRAIPVLISLTPGLLELPDTKAGMANFRESIPKGIGTGLRATLATGNLLTGSLYVAIDFYPDAPKVDPDHTFAGRPTIPSIESGLGGLEQRITLLLDRLNDLPLDKTVDALNGTLASIDSMFASKAMQAMPLQLEETLEELRTTIASFSDDSELQARLLPAVGELQRTLTSLRQVLDTIEEQPNSLIFNRDHREDPRPPVGPQ
jgi:paraquat-inducible protein B